MTKFAIITGASRGIGEGIARYFAKQGYDLALIARNKEALNRVKQSISSETPNINVNVYPLDISNTHETYRCIKTCIENKGRVDVLFNNAGMTIHGTSEVSIDEFQKINAVNVDGTFACAKAAAETMKKQGYGYIFNLASILGKMTLGEHGVYCSGKFAVVGFSESLLRELLPYGVKVSSLCPSVVDTQMTRDFDMPNEEKIQVNDIVKTVDYLLSLSTHAVIPTIDIHCKAIIEANIS